MFAEWSCETSGYEMTLMEFDNVETSREGDNLLCPLSSTLFFITERFIRRLSATILRGSFLGMIDDRKVTFTKEECVRCSQPSGKVRFNEEQ